MADPGRSFQSDRELPGNSRSPGELHQHRCLDPTLLQRLPEYSTGSACPPTASASRAWLWVPSVAPITLSFPTGFPGAELRRHSRWNKYGTALQSTQIRRRPKGHRDCTLIGQGAPNLFQGTASALLGNSFPSCDDSRGSLASDW